MAPQQGENIYMSEATVVENNTPKIKQPFLNSRTIEDDEREIQELEEQRLAESTKSNPREDTTQTSSQEDEMDALSDEEASFKKRYGDLRAYQARKNEEHRKALEAKERELEEARETQRIASLDLMSDEQFAEAAQEHPIVQRMIFTAVEKAKAELESTNRKREQKIKEDREEAAFETAQAKIRKAHPDYDEIFEAETEYAKKFYAWLQGRPQRVKDRILEGDEDETIDAITLWKETQPKRRGRPPKTEDAAQEVVASDRVSEPSSKGQYDFKESDIANMSDKEFVRIAEDFEKAQAAGRVLYDISGGAR